MKFFAADHLKGPLGHALSVVCLSLVLISAPTLSPAATRTLEQTNAQRGFSTAQTDQRPGRLRVATVLDTAASFGRPSVRSAPFLETQIERGLLQFEFLLRRGISAMSRGRVQRPLRTGANGCALGCVRGDGGLRAGRASRRTARANFQTNQGLPFATGSVLGSSLSQSLPPDSQVPAPVPLPPAAPLLLAGLGGMLLLRRRKRQ